MAKLSTTPATTSPELIVLDQGNLVFINNAVASYVQVTIPRDCPPELQLKEKMNKIWKREKNGIDFQLFFKDYILNRCRCLYKEIKGPNAVYTIGGWLYQGE